MKNRIQRKPGAPLYPKTDMKDGEVKDSRGKAIRRGGTAYVPRKETLPLGPWKHVEWKPAFGGTVSNIFRNHDGRVMVQIIERKRGHTRTVVPVDIRIQRVYPKKE